VATRRRQQNFEGEGLKAPKDSFGGDLLKNGNAKIKRPLDSKLPIHLVLRNTKGGMRLPRTIVPVKLTINRIAHKHGVRIYEYANVGNHLHMLIKIPQRERWSAFIRELTGQLAQLVQGITGRQKGMANFWKKRPFTRIVRGWRKAFQTARSYIELNLLEAEGMISRMQVKTLKDLRAIFESG
jgi:putative transposase